MRMLPVLGLAGIAGAVLLQGSLGDANAARRRNDFRYTPRPQVMRVVAGAHRSTFADTLWLRTLPDMARPFEDKELKKRWLDGVLTVVTDLDPGFITAYQYGSDYLYLVSGRETGVDEAIRFLEKGVERNPDNVQLRVSLAMAYHEGKHDRAKTLEHLEHAVAQEGCPDLTRSMLSALQTEQGEYMIALAYWEGMLEHGNARVRDQAQRNYEVVKKKIVIEVRKRLEAEHGRPPTTKDEYARSGLIPDGIREMILDCFDVDEEGELDFPRFKELDFRFGIRAVEGWTQIYRRDYGHWPTLVEVLENEKVPVPRLLPGQEGKHWAFDRGKLTLEDADG